MQTLAAARERLHGRIAIDFVPPDYYAVHPKACMNGWGRQFITVNPAGLVLPCHSAETIPGMRFDSVRESSLAEIWYRGEAFGKFRGTAWMQEPCRSCEHRERDFGGCRCQALAIAGEVTAADPVCEKSLDRGKIDALIAEAQAEPNAVYRYRGDRAGS
jgi:pyrroloquinoline quinone biosynthesis protein E